MIGIGPVGARRMIRLRGSEGGAGDSGGSFGAVTLTSVIADEQSAFSQPRHWVDSLGAALQHLEMQMRAGGIAAVAHSRDLVARHHPLPDADQRGVDVA